MAKLNLNSLNRRIDSAEAVREEYRSLSESAYELALPQRNLYRVQTQGESKMEKVFDSTGIGAVNGFVSRMTSSLTPAFSKWARLQAGPAIPEEGKVEANKVLEVITDVVFSVLNSSNFSVAIGEMYYDLAVGTGALLVQESDDDEKPIKFSAITTAHLALDEGESGEIEGIFRDHKLAARGILATWPDAKLNIELADIINDKPETEVTFKEVTYFDRKEKIWRYEIIYKKEDRIVERALKSNPWIIVRWSKVAGEVMGRGPLLQALPDLKMLNKGRELAIRSAQLNIFGAYTVADDGVTNPHNIRIAPNAMIPVARNGGPNGPSLQPLPRTGDLNAQNFMFEELKQQINRFMLNDRLPPDAGPVRSATEIVERIKELSTDIGSAFGRLMFELIQPLLQRVIHILENKNIITLGGGIKIDNINVTTQILSPISKLQAIDDVENVVQTDQILKQLDPSGQLTPFTLKLEDLGSWVATQLGVSASLINTQEEKEVLKQQTAQALQAQAEQEQQAQAQ